MFIADYREFIFCATGVVHYKNWLSEAGCGTYDIDFLNIN